MQPSIALHSCADAEPRQDSLKLQGCLVRSVETAVHLRLCREPRLVVVRLLAAEQATECADCSAETAELLRAGKMSAA